MKNTMFTDWLDSEINDVICELDGYCNNLEINTRDKITNGNIVELIR